MTYHLYYQHQCAGCGAAYIPYDADVPCPRCGILEDTRVPLYLAELASAVYQTVQLTNDYIPWTWSDLSPTDTVLAQILQVLETHRVCSDGRGLAQIAREHFSAHGVMSDYMQQLVLRLYAHMESDPQAVFPSPNPPSQTFDY